MSGHRRWADVRAEELARRNLPDLGDTGPVHVAEQHCPVCGLRLRWDAAVNDWAWHDPAVHTAMRERLVNQLARMMRALAGEEVPLSNWPGYVLHTSWRKYN